ncbi:MAG: Stk1 family PASTA domain-containing Ser/Thr kinase [Cellulomonadaceae bacterium]
MAEVHIGRDTRLGRTVAIKILRSDLARDPSFQARFRREAQAAAALNHPSIVAVYDTGEETYPEPSGAVAHLPFIVMEYVEGHTVRDILRDGHAVPIDEAVDIVTGVLSALEYSHQAGIVHRDIKPANVMITPTGAVKVMDFGIARALADSAATMTQTQAVIGTAQYLSPEQARGESVDARSDLYSTGCLLFELLTGRPPFTGDSPVAVAYQHVREAPPRPSSIADDVPESLDRITLKALAKDREDRYSSAAEFRADLEAAMHGGAIAAPALAAATAAATGRPQDMVDPTATQVLGGPSTQAMPAGWAPTSAATTAAATTQDAPRKSRKGLMWTLIAIAVLAIAGLVALILVNANKNAVETVAVPSLASLTSEQAEAALDEAGLVMRPLQRASTDVDTGLAIESDPPEGTEVAKGDTVTVYFSSGPTQTSVPNLKGMTLPEARRALEDASLVLGNPSTGTGNDVPRDRVVSSSPAADAAVEAGSTVDVVISDGQVEVPDVRGMTQEEAQKALSDLGTGVVSVTIVEGESDQAEGTITDQSPAAGIVSQGTNITLTVAVPMPPEMVAVPQNLVGKTQQEAEQLLREQGLAPVAETAESDRPAGTVFGVTPGSGVQVQVGSEVTLYISTGPADQPTDSPTTNGPTPTESPDD